MSSSSPSRVEDVAEDAQETEEDPLLSFRHIRTASVILPSGDRVRRKVSLMSTYDENPFEDDERRPLLDTQSGENTAYSSIPASAIDREIPSWEQSRFDKMKSFLRSEGLKRVLKCTLAYWIGSMATFWLPFAKFLGKSDGMHLVATVAVYFHPARSIGNMIETTGFALTALTYSVGISSGSMATAAYFNQIDSLALGHALTLMIWCGGGIGLLAYAKQKLGKPAFNTACSLACMVIFVNLVRDGLGSLLRD